MKNPNDDLYMELVDLLAECKNDAQRDFEIKFFEMIHGKIPPEYMEMLREKLERK